ncbi:SufE family protein [Terrarubrum flagellatum]|uniref:SufE family protein n=1 Tax=Terrirubrum flagellatum TaxID=2895980 RepID=UPI003145020A
MTAISEISLAIEQEFLALPDWEQRTRRLLDFGRQLPDMDSILKVEDNRVTGCQSQVWIAGGYDAAAGIVRLQAASDALIVRGLIALLLRLYSDQPPDTILAHSPDVFERIGLSTSLSPSRANGLYLMVKRIRELAAREGGS